MGMRSIKADYGGNEESRIEFLRQNYPNQFKLYASACNAPVHTIQSLLNIRSQCLITHMVSQPTYQHAFPPAINAMHHSNALQSQNITNKLPTNYLTDPFQISVNNVN
eukprot:249224_1